MSTTQHMYTPGVILASKATMDKLPEDLQTLVKEVGAEAAKQMKETMRQSQDEAAEKMVSGGLQITEVSSEVRDELAAKCSSIYDDNRDAIGAEFFDSVMASLGRA